MKQVLSGSPQRKHTLRGRALRLAPEEPFEPTLSQRGCGSSAGGEGTASKPQGHARRSNGQSANLKSPYEILGTGSCRVQSLHASLSPPWGFLATNGFKKRAGVCQLFPKNGDGDLTHGAAPLQGFWREAAYHPCLPPSMAALLPSQLVQNMDALPQSSHWPSPFPGVRTKKLSSGGEPGSVRREPGTLLLVSSKQPATLVTPESRSSGSRGAFPIPPH